MLQIVSAMETVGVAENVTVVALCQVLGSILSSQIKEAFPNVP
jgi:hypothetical protein